MAEKIIDIIATPELMPKIIALARKHGLEASAAMAVDSSSDALDAPVGLDEIRQVLEVITLLASTGTTVVGFLAALKLLLKSSERTNGKEPEVKVIETTSRRMIGSVTAETEVEELDIGP